MSLEATINEDIKSAMKSGEKVKLEALRSVKSAILLAKTEKGGSDTISPEAELAILNKLVKTRKESYDLYVANGRNDLAEVEKEQMEAIQVYLPAQMGDGELEAALKIMISQVGATGPGDLGKVMGMASKALAGKADGKRISETVKKLLS